MTLATPTAFVGTSADLVQCYFVATPKAPVAMFGQDGPSDSVAERPPSETMELSGVSIQLSTAPGFDQDPPEALATLVGWNAWIRVQTPGAEADALALVKSLARTMTRPSSAAPSPPVRDNFFRYWYHHDAGFAVKANGTAEMFIRGSCCDPTETFRFTTRTIETNLELEATVSKVGYLDENGKHAPLPRGADGYADVVGDKYSLTFAAAGLLRARLVRSGDGRTLHLTSDFFFCGDDLDPALSYVCGA